MIKCLKSHKNSLRDKNTLTLFITPPQKKSAARQLRVWTKLFFTLLHFYIKFWVDGLDCLVNAPLALLFSVCSKPHRQEAGVVKCRVWGVGCKGGNKKKPLAESEGLQDILSNGRRTTPYPNWLKAYVSMSGSAIGRSLERQRRVRQPPQDIA